MSFSDIASKFKKAAPPPPEPKAVDYEELYLLRGRMIGLLIRDARVARGYSVEHLAERLHVHEETLLEWEFGRQTPSLPQLEVTAYELEVPVSHFLNATDTLVNQLEKRQIDQDEYLSTRDHMIGVMLRLERERARFTLEYLSAQTGISPDLLNLYEYGQQGVPFSHLSAIASALGISVKTFLEGQNRVGRFLEAQELFDTFMEMDPQVRQFIAKPSNHSYIELAMKLAAMDIEKLRGIAESILEITY